MLDHSMYHREVLLGERQHEIEHDRLVWLARAARRRRSPRQVVAATLIALALRLEPAAATAVRTQRSALA